MINKKGFNEINREFQTPQEEDFQLNHVLRKEFHDIFSTRIYTIDIADSEILNEKLIKILDEETASGESRNISNIAGHQTRDGLFLSDAESKPKQQLLQEMLRAITDISRAMEVDLENYIIECHESWSNINFPKSANMSHHHPMSHWACVYYVHVPENSGKLLINDPRGGITQMYAMPFASGKSPHKNDKIEPNIMAGRLVLVPGWLMHEVTPNLSDETRYTIAANFSYFMKKDLTNQPK
jgi:uncharacterized protein (TIGR02466 family)